MNKLYRLIREFEILLFSIAILSIWFIGAIGFLEALDKAGSVHDWLDALYLSAQLFVLNSGYLPDAKNISVTFEITRWAAPSILAIATIRAVLSLARDHFNKIKLKFVSGHTVVCGLGDKGYQFVSSLKHDTELKSKIVIIELDPNNTYLDDVLNQKM